MDSLISVALDVDDTVIENRITTIFAQLIIESKKYTNVPLKEAKNFVKRSRREYLESIAKAIQPIFLELSNVDEKERCRQFDL